jgi:acetyl esterase/lipase
MGDKREQGLPMIYELARRGWVVVAINYRLSPRSKWPAQIVDCKRAIAWVRRHAAELGGDPGFLAVSGGSAGGHLAALAALTPGDPAFQPGFEDADTSVDACVGLYGVYDVSGGGRPSYARSLVRMLEHLVFAERLEQDPAPFEAASPIRRITREAPPFFVLHGRNDTMVPVTEARRFVSALRERSRSPVVYAELPLAQHAFDIVASPRSAHTVAAIVRFLDLTLARAREPEVERLSG